MPQRKCLVLLAALALACHIQRTFAGPTTIPSASPSAPLFLDDDDDIKPAATQNSSAAPGRYFFNLLDARSSYGKDFFPDPFLGPEFDRENQLEADYLHGEGHNIQDNQVDAELQWNVVGQLSLAAEFGWDSQHDGNLPVAGSGQVEPESGSGVESVDLAAYHPIFQYVSENNVFDYTAVARLDVAIPTRTPASGNDAQLTPYIGQLLRLGGHISIEAWTGSQFTIAPRQTDQFIYGASIGYQILRDQLPLPFTDEVIPLFELDGQRPFSAHADDSLFGVAGFDWQFKSIGQVQPAIGIGYQFPLDQGARRQLDWGILMQIFLQF